MEVENRPADGLKTVSPEEPYTNSVRTVLWELGASNRPWLPDARRPVRSRASELWRQVCQAWH